MEAVALSPAKDFDVRSELSWLSPTESWKHFFSVGSTKYVCVVVCRVVFFCFLELLLAVVLPVAASSIQYIYVWMAVCEAYQLTCVMEVL